MSEKKNSKHIYVSEETHKQAKVLAATWEMSVKDAVDQAIIRALAKERENNNQG